MYFELDVARSNRRHCYRCGKKIIKDQQCIRQHEYREGDDFPKTKYICFLCMPKVSSKEFIAFLEDLVLQLKSLQNNIEAGVTKHDDGIVSWRPGEEFND